MENTMHSCADQPRRRSQPRGIDRRAVIVGGLSLAGALLAACGQRRPVKLGFLAGMSGRVADLGIGGRNGAQLAVEELNAQGGVNGVPIEFVVADDEQNENTARQRLTEMAEAGVKVVVGPMTSSMAVALAPLAEQRGVVLISPTATTHELTGRRDHFFRVVPDAPTGARQQADYLLSLGARRLVTVADLKNRAFTQSWARAAEQQFRAAGAEVAPPVEFEAAPGLSFRQVTERVLSARAETVVIVASAADSALLVQQIRHAAPQTLMALSAWAGTEALLDMGGRALNGSVVAQYFDRTSTAPRYQAFVDAFSKRFGNGPGFPAVTAYDAARFAAEGLRGLATHDSMAAALRAIQRVNGLQRPIEIDEFGDSRSPMFLTEVRDGAFASLTAS
jgi:branched-chain amino acid transport system substrate-binding protein